MKFDIESCAKINQAISIGTITEEHSAFANYLLGALQDAITKSIQNDDLGIPTVKIADAITEAFKCTQNHKAIKA